MTSACSSTDVRTFALPLNAKASPTAQEGKLFLENLLEKVKLRHPQTEIRKEIAKGTKALTAYIHDEHENLLHSTDPLHKAHYREINRDFKKLFRYIADSTAQKIQDFEAWQNSSYGCEGRYVGENPFMELFFPQIPFNEDLLELRDAFIQFKKSYTCHFSLPKLQAFIKQRAPKLSQNNIDLLGITFLHATESSIFPSLAHNTALMLLPFGTLDEFGFVPFSGELGDGITYNGVNLTSISCSNLDGVLHTDGSDFEKIELSAIDYQEVLTKLIQDFDEKYANAPIYTSHQGAFGGTDFKKIGIVIQRCRLIHREFFEAHREKLQQVLERHVSNFAAFKQTDEYKKYIPPTHPDAYYKHHFAKMEHGLQYALNSLTKFIRPVKDIEKAISGSFLVIFGSTTIRTDYVDRDFLDRCKKSPATLGEDVTMIFTTSENRPVVQDFLNEQSLAEKVKICNADDLVGAVELNKIASLYFTDIASLAKLSLKTNTERDQNNPSQFEVEPLRPNPQPADNTVWGWWDILNL